MYSLYDLCKGGDFWEMIENEAGRLGRHLFIYIHILIQ